MSRAKNYTKDEQQAIVNAYNKGMSLREISRMTGRSFGGIYAYLISHDLYKKRTNPNENVILPKFSGERQKTLGDYSYDEIIRYLYKEGFRIENNQLVHYTKTPVKIENFI